MCETAVGRATRCQPHLVHVHGGPVPMTSQGPHSHGRACPQVTQEQRAGDGCTRESLLALGVPDPEEKLIGLRGFSENPTPTITRSPGIRALLKSLPTRKSIPVAAHSAGRPPECGSVGIHPCARLFWVSGPFILRQAGSV